MTNILLSFSPIMRLTKKQSLTNQAKAELERFEQNKKVVQELQRQLKIATERMESSKEDAIRSLEQLKQVYKQESTGLKLTLL